MKCSRNDRAFNCAALQAGSRVAAAAKLAPFALGKPATAADAPATTTAATPAAATVH